MHRPGKDGAARLRPYVVATGFTTAFLGDERTLREFMVGDHLRARIAAKGRTAVLVLINDSYDPLNERQLRVGVDKDQALIDRFHPFCGRPISEVPDPFDCHLSYSEHFAQALLERLHGLGIHPILLDSYRAYRQGHYVPFVRQTFDHYEEIRRTLASEFADFTMRNLYRPQCPHCHCIDATNVLGVHGDMVRYNCERCGRVEQCRVEEIQGKLSWKLDCAARWNLYDVHLEAFSKTHVAERGTLGISRLIARRFFGGVVPSVVTYGAVNVDRGMSGRLLEILPPRVFRALFVSHMRRDLTITRDFVENFCQKAEVADGMSYGDYVRRELPRRALGPGAGGLAASNGNCGSRDPGLDDACLVTHAIHYARFYYGRDHSLRLPDVEAVAAEGPEAARAASRVIRFAVAAREGTEAGDAVPERIRSYIFQERLPPRTFPYLRRIFRQSQGPRMAGLLALLPLEYLKVVQSTLDLYARSAERPTRDSIRGPAAVEEIQPGGKS